MDIRKAQENVVTSWIGLVLSMIATVGFLALFLGSQEIGAAVVAFFLTIITALAASNLSASRREYAAVKRDTTQ